MKGRLLIVGFGPGGADHVTPAAKKAIESADVVVGYITYINLVRPLLSGKKIVATGMTEEISRAKKAVDYAKEGKTVAVVSSGDAGIYGMAGLIYEVLKSEGWKPPQNGEADSVEVEVIPGITAISSVASLLGAPIMHDFCSISLSDLLTPWEVIRRRVEAAAEADFVLVLYNPKSGRRTWQIGEVQKILLKHRDPKTPVGIVKSAYRPAQRIVLTDIEHMLEHEIGMLTTIIVGNSNSYVYEGRFITPRGYTHKYFWDGSLKPGQRRAHSLVPDPVVASASPDVPKKKCGAKVRQEDLPAGAVLESGDECEDDQA